MPELLIDVITSLDGHAAAGGWPGWWGLEAPERLAWLGEQPEAKYPVLMGRTTYRVTSGYAAEGEPGTDSGSKSMHPITSLKRCRSLLNAGLVDRFRLIVFPVITGGGGRELICDGYRDAGLDMISSRTFVGRTRLL